MAPVGGQSASGREALFFSKFSSLSSLFHSTRNIPLLFLFSLVSWLPHLMSAAFPWCCWRHSVWQPFAVQLGRVIVGPCETHSEVALAKPGVLGLLQKDHSDLPGSGGILQAWPRDRAEPAPVWRTPPCGPRPGSQWAGGLSRPPGGGGPCAPGVQDAVCPEVPGSCASSPGRDPRMCHAWQLQQFRAGSSVLQGTTFCSTTTPCGPVCPCQPTSSMAPGAEMEVPRPTSPSLSTSCRLLPGW